MPLDQRELSSIAQTILSGQGFKGTATDQYEKLLLSELSAKYVCCFPSGRSGFYFLIKALFKPGDEVILSAYSFALFVRIFHEQGIKPVIVDVNREDALINPELIEEKITKNTKGILVTHLFGNPCDMQKICFLSRKYNLHLLEDCAHAFGSSYQGRSVGSFGTAGIFSTSPMKIPTTLGGGFVVTNDQKLYETMKGALQSDPGYQYSLNKFLKIITFTLIYYLNSFPAIFSLLSSQIFRYLKLKNPGALRKLFYSELIVQKPFDPFERSILTNMQASVGLVQLNKKDEMISRQRDHARILNEAFKDSKVITPFVEKKGEFNNFLYYIIRLPYDAESFVDQALLKGLYLMRENVWNCNDFAFAQDYRQVCPVAKEIQPLLVRLPNSSLLSDKHIEKVISIVKEII